MMFIPQSLELIAIIFTMMVCSVNSRGMSHLEAIQRTEITVEATQRILDTISERWQILEYPTFLGVVDMSESSWELLRVKFQHRILTALLDDTPADQKKNETNKFVISFLGTSVTAGHDTPFNITVSELTRQYMKPAFDIAGIELEVINGAMGNNPCMPYDLCVKAFAGLEADIIQWEQSFNCFAINVDHVILYEQFVRQSLDMKSKPVIAFSTSDTPNWDVAECKEKENRLKPALTFAEKEILTLYEAGKHAKKAALIPKPEIRPHFQFLLPLIPLYRTSGIQLWDHRDYHNSRCHGPYIPAWNSGGASWHPSRLGQELRAAHYSFYWLSVYKDALQTVHHHLNTRKEDDGVAFVHTVDAMLTRIRRHIDNGDMYLQKKQYFPSNFTDNMQCLTSFHPISDPSSDLTRHALSNNIDAPVFQRAIIEDLVDPMIIIGARKAGYKDFKYSYYGNSTCMPLSIKINVKKEGYTFLCQPLGVHGQLPEGFHNFWDVDTRVYIRENVDEKSYENFQTIDEYHEINSNIITTTTAREIFHHDLMHSKLLDYFHSPYSSEHVCAQFSMMLPIGFHVLTIVPPDEHNIAISSILLP